MDFKPRSHEKIQQLLDKGVNIPNPATLDIGDDVRIDQISGQGTTIYPGCRIYGKKTVISADCKLGYEAPATIEDCRLGPRVELKGGFFSKSVFLEKANLGMGAHVREGCLLEEEAGGAHCVGLKQTILFPFVTLGSLINFCDCLMAGGTSRSNHSEVGSSYIHFNFTPDADKTTPSLLGDVPRGVMLNRPPIFLGGQGGIIGPVRLGYGNVVAAGSVLRHDYPEDGLLIFETTPAAGAKDFLPAAYPNLRKIVENNFLYLANLCALESWYTHVRKPFLEAQPFGSLLYAGVLETLASAGKERLKRFKAMAQKAAASPGKNVEARQELHRQAGYFEDLFTGKIPDVFTAAEPLRNAFLEEFWKSTGNDKTDYIGAVQSLPGAVSAKGTQWLSGIVQALCDAAARALPSMGLYKS
ncbi:MAG TPA: UDP-N-acetylglucosamine pyrophosphorylase [Smithellaceae bacterium]|nr:UDP-N-acetylglucosamine pyrophosphorylase [Smithellaceae bacterium]HRS83176.1 UDP-N-acetylglucosamine pyrophosphorylase [Smithellaceae bacterium]HRV44455.1 UDP-N-acetylglucosamine pyrophosphorylase [Smithellaceae bacterium]